MLSIHRRSASINDQYEASFVEPVLGVVLVCKLYGFREHRAGYPSFTMSLNASPQHVEKDFSRAKPYSYDLFSVVDRMCTEKRSLGYHQADYLSVTLCSIHRRSASTLILSVRSFIRTICSCLWLVFVRCSIISSIVKEHTRLQFIAAARRKQCYHFEALFARSFLRRGSCLHGIGLSSLLSGRLSIIADCCWILHRSASEPILSERRFIQTIFSRSCFRFLRYSALKHVYRKL